MQFQKIFGALRKSRSGASSGGQDRSSDTKMIDPTLLHPQSHLRIGSSKSSRPSTSTSISRGRKSDIKQSGCRIRLSTSPCSFCWCETGNATVKISVVPDRSPSVPNVNESEPAKLSSYVIDPSAAYENKLSWRSTVYASAKVVIDVVKESSDVFTPLKSVAGGLSAVLNHYDVRYTYLASSPTPFTVIGAASDGESTID